MLRIDEKPVVNIRLDKLSKKHLFRIFMKDKLYMKMDLPICEDGKVICFNISDGVSTKLHGGQLVFPVIGTLTIESQV